MKYFISAGEASGDLHASRLIFAIKGEDPQAEFAFLGGTKMSEAAGIKPVICISEMSVMGFGQVIRRLPRILGQIKRAKEYIDRWHPDAVVLVDYPSFNLKLAAHANRRGLKVFWYISPKVWVWKEYRVKAMKKYIDRLYSILPFEVEYFKRRHNWDVIYVGNPSAEEIGKKKRQISATERRGFLKENHINDVKPILALLPGSRVKEIESNLPVMVKVAGNFPEFQPVIAAVEDLPDILYSRWGKGIPIITDKTFELLGFSDAALVTSGTATLETAILKVPQVMMYRHSGSKLIYKLFRRLLKVDYFSLPNLINGNETIPELVMHMCTPEAVSGKFMEIIPGGSKHEIQQENYKNLVATLGYNSPSGTVAKDIIATLTAC